MHRASGITLIELLTALAVIAVLAGLAVPALDGLLLNARRAAAMEGLFRAAWLARTEALRLGRPVLLCGSALGDGCDGDPRSWTAGWVVVPADPPAEVLRRGGGIARAGARLLSNRSAFRFEAAERRSTNGTLAWCDRRGAAAARAIVISPTGRPRHTHGSGSLECSPP